MQPNFLCRFFMRRARRIPQKDRKMRYAYLNSYYVTAYHGDTLIAFARAISDGHYYTGIYDVIVKPQYQKKGIAKEMMKMLLRKFKGTYFFLSYTEGNRDFYKKFGFKVLSNGMCMDREKSFNLNIDSL